MLICFEGSKSPVDESKGNTILLLSKLIALLTDDLSIINQLYIYQS
jgi:hypothetical protein